MGRGFIRRSGTVRAMAYSIGTGLRVRAWHVVPSLTAVPGRKRNSTHAPVVRATRTAAVVVLVALSGCATVPSGPRVTVLPGTDKTLEQFRTDDALCRQFANQQVSGTKPTQAAEASVQKSAAAGAVVGAAAGAALGGEHGAVVGAGSGLLIGTAAGTDAGRRSASAVQQGYDSAYVQCMYTQGNRVPVSGLLVDSPVPGPYPPPPPASYRPPPAADFYPLPPPDYRAPSSPTP